ncbi:MAG: hypothetical protein P4L35_02685 [Ignavibacteriaceae bacterium]|nr:hypothetical protein [Ignavibacteriaceae bacterium]
MSKYIFIIISLFLYMGTLTAQECYPHRYYVDNDSGDDINNSGKKSCDGIIHPWKTISQVNYYSS